MLTEINFDGIIGPTHNYAGLSRGNIASAFLAVLIFADGRIVNPAFGTALSGFIGDNGFVTSMFTRFHLFFVGVILFALVLETSETLYRYFRGKV